jgi:hypothetical protein
MKSSFLLFNLLLMMMPALAGSQEDRGPPADVLAVRNVEVTFHTAGSVLPEKSLDLMMGIFADDAVLTDTAHENKAYTGKAEVRRYWADVSGPFRPEHHWIGYTPAMRMHAEVKGSKASLYFECLWMDVDRNAVGAHSFSEMKLSREHGHWLVKGIRVGNIEKL